ncbi:MAG TPA: SDR family oxidoreductase [Candidatus Sulfotelmatobacter sp.]|nr:SDR family oxidoreductase [Candidatus Sulfotelmatobacter sp.]
MTAAAAGTAAARAARYPDLAGKRALVTGHRGGIGQAIAHVLADNDVQVVGMDRPEIDLADGAALAALAARIVAAEGPFDILVNNAGATDLGSILDTPLEQVDRLMAVNFKAPFILIKAVLPAMIARGAGAVVNIASDQVLIGKRFSAAYGASKAALGQLTKSAALDFAPRNIRFNCIAPGSTDTPMLHMVMRDLAARYPASFSGDAEANYRAASPLGRFADPREIAAAAAFLASDAASFITGSIFAVDGGGTAQ